MQLSGSLLTEELGVSGKLRQKPCQKRNSVGTRVVKADVENKSVHLESGNRISTASWLVTMPVDELSAMLIASPTTVKPVQEGVKDLYHSSTHVVGIGIRRSRPDRIGDNCWVSLTLVFADICFIFRKQIARSVEPQFSQISPNTINHKHRNVSQPSDSPTANAHPQKRRKKVHTGHSCSKSLNPP